jgi:hypothetical protein
MKPPKEFIILIGKQSLYFGEGRHKDTQNLQKGEVKGSEIELYIANLLRRIINLKNQNELLTREDISRLGRMLYNFLKEWNLDVAFRRFYREIAEVDPSGPGFGRIYLEFIEDADLLALLPWEFLSYGEKDDFLGAHQDVKFDLIRRYAFHSDKAVFSYSPKPEPTGKLKVLLIHAEPAGRPFEGDQLAAFLESLQQQQLISLEVVAQPSFDSFPNDIAALAQKGFYPDLIHFAGYGEINEGKGYAGFVDPGDDSKADWVEDRQLISFLAPLWSKVKLVFLHTCEGGMVGDYGVKTGLGLQMLREKIPALVTMQAPVKPLVALDFARVFYESLLSGADIGRAVTAGRKKLCFELQENSSPGGFNKRFNPYGEKSFGLPVLFITTEEPFPLIAPEGEGVQEQAAEEIVYYECQNRPNPRCLRIRLVEQDELGCPVCGGPLVPSQKTAAQPAQSGQSLRVPTPGKSKAGKAPAGEVFVLPGQNGRKKEAAPSELVILFLAANPKDTSRLRFDEEARRIKEALGRSKYRDKFRLIQEMAVQIPDLRRALLDNSPGIVHFTGHGTSLGRIYLEDATGNAQEVSAEALGNFLKLFREHIRAVVLNACYSEEQAKEIVKHGIPVVGMKSEVPDKAGVEFSEAFYDALGAGKSLEFAFELGCSAIEMYNLSKEDIPRLLKPEN